MAIDYRYHLASIVAIFIALLLGIMIGIGVAPTNPAELKRIVTDIRNSNEQTQQFKAEELVRTQQQLDEVSEMGKVTLPVVIAHKLDGQKIALVIDHEFPGEFIESIRALFTQAGAEVISTTTITKNFITMPDTVRQQISSRLLLYPPADVPVQTTLAQTIAREIATVRAGLIPNMESIGLITTSSDSSYTSRPDAVVLVGGANDTAEVLPDLIDVPFITEVQRFGVRIVACESGDSLISCIPNYKAQGITTVDNVDRLAGKLSLVWAVAGAEGHFGAKDTADQLLPELKP